MLRIAIDGPGGAGKSTIAKLAAKRLGLEYIDTGAMYRACGLKVMEQGIDPEDEEALAAMLAETDIDFRDGRTLLDGKDVSEAIRTEEAGRNASRISAKAPVRKKLVELQRQIGASRSVVMDGRDIGTNVMTDAEVKIFLTADERERASRRYLQLKEKGEEADFDRILEDIRARDYNDTHRKLDPLRKAEDAVEIDSTHMTIEEVTDRILKETEKHGNDKTV